MSTARIVVDPSVAIKWYIPEEQAPLAKKLKEWLLGGPHRVVVPTLFFDEITNILWKKECLHKEITPRTTKEIVWEILRLPLHVYLDRHELLPMAAEIARENRISVYDALYLATAIQNDTVFVTADEQLVRKIAKDSKVSFMISLAEWETLKES